MTFVSAPQVSATHPIGPGRGDLRVAFHWYDPDVPLTFDRDVDASVWLIAPDVGGDRDADIVSDWLSEPERARRARIQHPRAMAEFLAGRRLIRDILGQVLGVAPAAVNLVENRYGALSLDPSYASPWQFNLSHTDGLLALALSRQRIGVDVEWISRPGRTVELADRYFAKTEVAALRALSEAAQRDRFFALWTLKEAYIKARGMGLAIPLSDFAYDLDSAHIRLAVADSIRDVPDEMWHFHLADLGGHHRIALAMSPLPT